MSNKYCEFRTDEYDAGPPIVGRYRFKAVAMRVVDRKAQSVRETLGGTLDTVFGKSFELYRLVLRVPYQTNETDMSDWEDLRALYALNNPNAAITPVLIFIDHFGTTHNTAYLVGELVSEPIATVIDGTDNAASYIVPVEIAIG
jgi:hypothetical protein